MEVRLLCGSIQIFVTIGTKNARGEILRLNQLSHINQLPKFIESLTERSRDAQEPIFLYTLRHRSILFQVPRGT